MEIGREEGMHEDECRDGILFERFFVVEEG